AGEALRLTGIGRLHRRHSPAKPLRPPVPGRLSTLPLFVPTVGAGHSVLSLSPDNLALVAAPLDAWLNLHFGCSSSVTIRDRTSYTHSLPCSGIRPARATGRTGKAPRRPCPREEYGYSAAASCH